MHLKVSSYSDNLKQYTSIVINRKVSVLLMTAVFSYFCFLILYIPEPKPVTGFPDTVDNHYQSVASFFSADLYFPAKKLFQSPRPFTFPLFLKMAGSDDLHMFFLQKAIYCLSCGLFSFCLACFINNSFLRVITFTGLLYFFTWWNVVGWSDIILSESLSVSFLLLWLANLFWFKQRNGRLQMLVLFPVTALFSFTRDTWPYLIFTMALLIFLFEIRKAEMRRLNGIFLIFASVLLSFQTYTVQRGERAVLPVFNNLAGRITKNTEHVAWFYERGMPQANRLRSEFVNIPIDSSRGRERIYRRYIDSAYAPLFRWVRSDGMTAYRKFLLTHPQYLILNDQTPQQLERIFCYNLYFYYSKPQKFFHNASCFFPVFNKYVALALCCITLFCSFRRKRRYLLIPSFMALLFIFNAYLSYNADALEVERHLYLTTIGVELASLINLVFIADIALCRFRRRSTGPAAVQAGQLPIR